MEADASHRQKLTAWNKEATPNSPLLPHRVGYVNRECLALWRAAGFFEKELQPNQRAPPAGRAGSRAMSRTSILLPRAISSQVCIDCSDVPNALLCPYCRGPWLHHEDIISFGRRAEDAPSIVTRVHRAGRITRMPSEQSRNPSARRDGVAIRFWCETCGEDNIELVVEQHKGNSFLRWRTGPAAPANGRRPP